MVFGYHRRVMDLVTVNYYDHNAQSIAEKYRSVDQREWRKQFNESFVPGGRILDLGSGSGRDVAALIELGFDAFGIEPSEGMRTESVRAFPQLAGRISP